MSVIRLDGEWSPEFGGRVRGGVTMVCRTPGELGEAAIIVALARSQLDEAARSPFAYSPEHPLHFIHRQIAENMPGREVLKVGSRNFDRLLDLDELVFRKPDADTTRPDLRAYYTILDDIQAALVLSRLVWTDDIEIAHGEFALAFSIADPLAPEAMDVLAQEPSLVFHQGSLRSQLTERAVRTAGWATTIAPRIPIASLQARELVRRLRGRRQESARFPNLRDIQTLTRRDVHRSRALIILIHGLISTDVGTFDELLPFLPGDVLTVGFPHNSLAAIDDNALDLADYIQSFVTTGGPPVIFVCHSRGGLVARAASAELMERHPQWRGVLRGCVTFGAPHLGAELADVSRELLAVMVLLEVTRKTGSINTLSEVFSYLASKGTLAGIEDLRPSDAIGGSFLSRLRRREGRVGRVPLLAIGGVAERTGIRSLVDRTLGTVEHDLVVTTESSVPQMFVDDERHVTNRDHLSYFTGSDPSDYLLAADYVTRRVLTGRRGPRGRSPREIEQASLGSGVVRALPGSPIA